MPCQVIPINNLADTEPPERLSDLELFDRPNDDGSALLLTFELSQASDIGSYEVYASSTDFSSVAPGSGGPSIPIASLDRTPDLPLEIKEVMGDLPVLPGMEIWVAVVAIDTSGNAYLDDLTVVSSQAVDDGFDDSGDYMTPVEDLQAVWNDVGILVTWSAQILVRFVATKSTLVTRVLPR